MTRNTDFTQTIKEVHENKWVALSEDGTKVIAYSEKLKDLNQKIGDMKVVYMKVPSSDIKYAF